MVLEFSVFVWKTIDGYIPRDKSNPPEFVFLWLHPWHMEVPRLGVDLELQLPAYTTARATQNLSQICVLYHSSQQSRTLNPRSRARNQTCVLMDPSQIHFHWATMGTPQIYNSLAINVVHFKQVVFSWHVSLSNKCTRGWCLPHHIFGWAHGK